MTPQEQALEILAVEIASDEARLKKLEQDIASNTARLQRHQMKITLQNEDLAHRIRGLKRRLEVKKERVESLRTAEDEAESNV